MWHQKVVQINQNFFTSNMKGLIGKHSKAFFVAIYYIQCEKPLISSMGNPQFPADHTLFLKFVSFCIYFIFNLLTGSGILSRLGPQPGEVTSSADVIPKKNSATAKASGVFGRLGKKLSSWTIQCFHVKRTFEWPTPVCAIEEQVSSSGLRNLY